MNLWRLLSTRNPLWRLLGPGIVLGVTFATGAYIHRGTRPPEASLREASLPGQSGVGRQGTIIEQLGDGRFVVSFDRIAGTKEQHQVEGVTGILEEPKTHWRMQSPQAAREQGIWTLDGPMKVEAKLPGGPQIGRGEMVRPGPALKWERGVWTGLQPLSWESLDGPSRGTWSLPEGWNRDLEGRFRAEKGPVRWVASGPGAIRWMESERLWVTLGLEEGEMETVRAGVEGGTLSAPLARVSPERLSWPSGLQFRRDDGWQGQAEEGSAPRPPEGQPLECLELKKVKARRSVPEGTEHLDALGARWTPTGFRLEGDVRWEQPAEGHSLVIRAPRVMFRQVAGGTDLPEDLPPGDARAEGRVVLTWNGRSMSTPSATLRKDSRQWWVQAPILGRSEWGTFQSGPGSGDPRRWVFTGPIQAWLVAGGSLRGDRLVWEEEAWTFTGKPATWQRIRERLSGPRIVRKNDHISFPEGLNGALAADEGDLLLRADCGESVPGRIQLEGRVECRGQGYRIQADRVEVEVGAGNTVQRIQARGKVQLEGAMGEGRGDFLDLDPQARSARWEGKVRGRVEVQR